MDLRMRVRAQGEATILEVGGEMDLHSAPQLRAALRELTEAPSPRIVIDLSDVTFIDSTGVGTLVGALKRARESGGALHFCGAQSRVRRVFEITGLLGALPLFDSRQAALVAFDANEQNAGEANFGEANFGEANFGEANFGEANFGEVNTGDEEEAHDG